MQKRKDQTTERLKKFCKNFLEQYEILTQKMKIPAQYLRDYNLFPKEPFEAGNSVSVFLKHVKSGNLVQVHKMIEGNALLVFQFDELHQTGLIWATKRNNLLMVRLLLKKHSRVNFKDLPGRSALHFAIRNNNEEIVRMLLCFRADPHIEDNNGQSSIAIFEAMCRQKQINLKIGGYLKLASSQLFRQKYLIDFLYKAQMALTAAKEKEQKN